MSLTCGNLIAQYFELLLLLGGFWIYIFNNVLYILNKILTVSPVWEALFCYANQDLSIANEKTWFWMCAQDCLPWLVMHICSSTVCVYIYIYICVCVCVCVSTWPIRFFPSPLVVSLWLHSPEQMGFLLMAVTSCLYTTAHAHAPYPACHWPARGESGGEAGGNNGRKERWMVGLEGRDMKQWSQKWRRSFGFSMSVIYLSFVSLCIHSWHSTGDNGWLFGALNKPCETIMFF